MVRELRCDDLPNDCEPALFPTVDKPTVALNPLYLMSVRIPEVCIAQHMSMSRTSSAATARSALGHSPVPAAKVPQIQPFALHQTELPGHYSAGDRA